MTRTASGCDARHHRHGSPLDDGLLDHLVEEPVDHPLTLGPDPFQIALHCIDGTEMTDCLGGLQPTVQHAEVRGQALQLFPIERAGYLVVAASPPFRENNRANCILGTPRSISRRSSAGLRQNLE